ncbi:MAG TPA: c-type cytochrome [Verrucomicrobiae bacterium]
MSKMWFSKAALFLSICASLSAQTTPSATGLVASNLKVPKDFRVDMIYAVPKEQEGSWVAMCMDPKGRMIVSDQYGKLFRLTLPALNVTAEPQVETIDAEIGCAQGLLYAFDSLYVMVNEEKFQGRGLYRLRDTNGDDKYDEVKLLRKLQGGGEHGPHAIVLSPDKQSLYVVIGNQTKLTEINSSRVPLIWSEDHLLPRMSDGNGFMKGVLAPGGWIAKVDPEGQNWELIANGFRNEYDAAFNADGELFTFDADMEWDLNTPWYRPTRVNHVISGAEFGWRNGAGKHPAYYIDTFGAVTNVGPGSPTGVTFGYGARFPAKYQKAFYIADWSFGKLYAVHLEPNGSTYNGELEEFITGQPLALTDLVVNPNDGAMYFAVGGRRTQSALYRVTYTGSESTKPAKLETKNDGDREKRRRLEAFHGKKDPDAVKEAWKHLDSEDRAMRFAARVALEWQDTALWREKALKEKDERKSIAALVALARASSRDEFHRKENDPKPDAALQGQILTALDRIEWKELDTEQDRLDLLRAYTLTFTRLGKPDESTRRQLAAKFEPLYPARSRELNAELAPMLVYLESPTAASKLVAALRTAPTQEEQIDIARALRVAKTGWTQPMREEYFRWFLKAANFKGGSSMRGFLRDIKADAMDNLSEADQLALKPILETKPQVVSPFEALTSREVVKQYTVADLAPTVEKGVKSKRDFERGRVLFGQAGCAACHRFGDEGASVGPDLTNLAGRFSVRDVLESTLEPSKEISDQYGAIVIKKKDGDVVVGRVGNLNGDNLMVIENMFAPGDFTQVKRSQVETIEPSKVSMMPEGLLNYFKEDEILDLMAYLLSRGDRNAKMFSVR